MKKHVFVYGTLLFPEIVKVLTGKKLTSIDALLNNYKRFKIIDKDIKRPYPAIKKLKWDNVVWKLFLDVAPSIVDIFNFYEGNEYIENEVTVLSKGIKYKASVYVWDKNYDLLQWDWDKENFKSKYLDLYVNKEIPEQFLNYKKDLQIV